MQIPCVVCGSKENDAFMFGEMSATDGKMMHRNCYVLCLGKFLRNKNQTYRMANFLKNDILMEKHRFARTKCTYCLKRGANLSCGHEDCQRSFHTKCGVQNMAVLQYGGRYDSFCAEHVPHQGNSPGPEETCVLCLALIVPEGKTYMPALAFQAPCCRSGWFHRDCLQDHSMATTDNFKCPLCRNENSFAGVAMFGVSIPKWRFALPDPPRVLLRTRARRIRRLVGPRIIHTPPITHRMAPRAPRNRMTIP